MADAIGTLDDFALRIGREGDGLWPQRIVFAFNTMPSPRGSFQVAFPRLELVLDGCYRNTLAGGGGAVGDQTLCTGEALFIPADCWNKPAWDCDVHLLSLLFGAKHLGVSIVRWSGERQAFTSVDKYSCLVPGNSPLYHMVDALSCLQPENASTAFYGRLLAKALVEYAKILLSHPLQDDERQSSALYRAVCSFLEENFDKLVTRDIVAREFQVSPNYLSRVFSDHGETTFSDFLTSIRIGKAKTLLESSPLSLAEVAQRCGFHDPNYFFKVFKKRVKRTPTEYRSSVLAAGPHPLPLAEEGKMARS